MSRSFSWYDKDQKYNMLLHNKQNVKYNILKCM